MRISPSGGDGAGGSPACTAEAMCCRIDPAGSGKAVRSLRMRLAAAGARLASSGAGIMLRRYRTDSDNPVSDPRPGRGAWLPDVSSPVPGSDGLVEPVEGGLTRATARRSTIVLPLADRARSSRAGRGLPPALSRRVLSLCGHCLHAAFPLVTLSSALPCTSRLRLRICSICCCSASRCSVPGGNSVARCRVPAGGTSGVVNHRWRRPGSNRPGRERVKRADRPTSGERCRKLAGRIARHIQEGIIGKRTRLFGIDQLHDTRIDARCQFLRQ